MLLAYHPKGITSIQEVFAFLSSLQYPQIVQPKLDGVRFMTKYDRRLSKVVIRTRADKPFSNLHIQAVCDKLQLPPYLDGELIYGESFSQTVGNINTISYVGKPQFYVFDVTRGMKFLERYHLYDNIFNRHEQVLRVPTHVASSPTEAMRLFQEYTDEDTVVYPYGEGIVLRNPNRPYKVGRSTFKSGELIAVKLRDTSVVQVVGRTRLECADEVPREALGAFICTWSGHTFNVGSGFTDAQRVEFWNKPIPSEIRISHFDCGSVTVPRHPVFLEVIK